MGVLALVLIVAWLVIVAGVRGYLRQRRTGDVGVHARDKVGSAQWWSKITATVGLMSLFIAAIADIAGLAPFGPLDSPVVAGAGMVLWGLGIIGTVGSQLVMGDSWRGDVDPDARTALVTTGPYRVIRNPILTSTYLTALGIALVVPNVFAAVMLVLIGVAYEIQVRLVEEPYLLRVHGDAWRRYAAGTGRFLPGIGRVRRAG